MRRITYKHEIGAYIMIFTHDRPDINLNGRSVKTVKEFHETAS